MYPGTEINKWIDETIEGNKVVAEAKETPLFLTASSFDKGPEDMRKISGSEFYKLYGTDIRFSKHGQPAIQAARIIDAGGELLVKRIVADDATLPNIIFLATLNSVTETEEEDEIIPNTNLEIPNQTDQWLGKLISDMVADDVSVDINGKVYGTIKHTEFVEFNSTEISEQTGFYFPFKIIGTTGTLMTLKTNGVVTKEDIPFDPEIIFKVKPENTYEVEVDGVPTITLSFDNAKFENEDGTVDTDNSEIDVNTTTSVKWSAVYIENCYSFEQVKEEAIKLYDPENGVFPLIIVTDNGRGEGLKSVCISRNRELSLSEQKQFFDVSVYEGSVRTDNIIATIGDTVYNKKQYGLEEFSATQVKFHVEPEILDMYTETIANIIGVDKDTTSTYDLINMQTIKGSTLDGIEVDKESIDLAVTYGVNLQGGSNGEFGSNPVGTPAWEEALNEFFSGSFDNALFDLDEYRIGAIVDASYPYSVKETIAELATFREDCVFFRDMCLDVNSCNSIIRVIEDRFLTKNKFIASYLTWYQIYDPVTNKRISVTMMYDFAACLVNAFNKGICNPIAGYINDFVLESVIEGTINFIPRKTKAVNQKQILEDLKVNYAIFQNGECIVQTLYSDQQEFSQLSFINNVLGIQSVLRTVRDLCPKKRYTFIDNGDFSEYSDDVNKVLKNFKDCFDYLKFAYYKDSDYVHHKIFYGAIEFAFKDWAQTELFDVYVIGNDQIDEDDY